MLYNLLKNANCFKQWRFYAKAGAGALVPLFAATFPNFRGDVYELQLLCRNLKLSHKWADIPSLMLQALE